MSKAIEEVRNPGFVAVDDPAVRAGVAQCLQEVGLTPIGVDNARDYIKVPWPCRCMPKLFILDTKAIRRDLAEYDRDHRPDAPLPTWHSVITQLQYQPRTVVIFYDDDTGFDQMRYRGGRRFNELAAVHAAMPNEQFVEFVRRQLRGSQR